MKSVKDNCEIVGVGILAVNKDGLNTRIDNLIDILCLDFGLAVENNLVTLDRNHLTGILIDKVFNPCFEHTGSEFTSNDFFEFSFSYLDFFSKIEDFHNVLVGLVTDSTQQSGNRQFLFAVDVGIHHIVDVGSEFNPRAAEWNNAGAVKFSAVGMNALTKEHTGRTVELRNNNTLGTIDNKSAFIGHIRDCAEIDILYHGVEFLMVGVGTIQLKFRLQRYTIGQTMIETLIDRVARWVDIVIKEL